MDSNNKFFKYLKTTAPLGGAVLGKQLGGSGTAIPLNCLKITANVTESKESLWCPGSRTRPGALPGMDGAATASEPEEITESQYSWVGRALTETCLDRLPPTTAVGL